MRSAVRRAAPFVLLPVAVGALVALGLVARDDLRARAEVARQAQRADSLARSVSTLNGQVGGLRAQNGQLQEEARSPTLTMWNSCDGPCSIGPAVVRVGSVPDTFQLLIAFSADVPVRTYVLTFHQWTQFDDCGLSVRCVSGAFTTFDAATSVDRTFDDAEGCSAYVWVLQADRAGTITPNVRVRYRPAAHPTGVCAGSE
jgi:hypothetical protein